MTTSSTRSTSSTSSRSGSYHHGDLRQALVSEAVRIIREEGEKALSMRKLALNIGVSRTASYHYFADKQALLCAIAEEGFRRYNAMLSEVHENGQRPPSAESMRDFVRGYVQFATEQTEYYDLMFGGHIWESGTSTDSLRKESHNSFRNYVSNVRNWKEQGLISDKVDALRFSQVSWSTLHGISRLIIDGIYADSAAIEPICQNAAEMFWRELAP
ncbi:TetR family transcriptional regulator [Microbulbifer agarilyticus]|uniref:TetR family transcriptional regulator n=1 Tax=Microbulbifer agarilyticus TaxID=260552 RepID=A0A1Q2M8R1_9GAMM|nr:TetR/AcrR family transcriptional regulator [Microbulbifer agarilyticus]AQQ69061.1 TetR family transcriptional regulator [Microbulbifer agarilyticus]